MKNKLLILITLLLAAVLCFAACSNKPDDGNEGDVVANGIKSIEVVEGTIPTQINMGSTPDFSGIKVKVTFNDGTTKEIGFADVTVTELDTMTAGEKYITVTYGEISVKIKVMVVDPIATRYVTNINILEGSFDKGYHLGQIPDITKLQVEAVYSDGTKDALDPSEYTYTTVDTSVAGKYTFTVTYTANPEIKASVEYEVFGITGAQVVTGSVAKKINVGEALDTSKLQLVVTYADGKEEIAEGAALTIGTIDTTTYGKKNLEIVYKGVTYTYEVEVVGVVSVAVNKGSYDEKVKVNSAYAAPNITAVLTFSDGTQTSLTAADLTLGQLDTASAGKKNLTVSYAGLTTSVEIEVVGVADIEVVEDSINAEILIGTTLNTSGIKALVTYTDGTQSVVGASELTLGAFDSSVAGNQNLSVTYLGKTIQYAVKVCTITSLRVEDVNRVVPAGQPIDLSNMKVYGVYNDADETEVLLTSGVTTNVDSLDINSEEDKILVVSYNGINANVIISTTAPQLVGIEIRSWQKSVVLNGTFNTSSVNVYAVYANGSSEKITGFTLTDVATNVAGNVKLKATYEGKTDEVDVAILPISNIELVGGIASSVYRGDTLDTSGAQVKVTYSDGTHTSMVYVNADKLTISKPDTSTGGDKSLTITYNGSSISVSYKVIAEKSISIFSGVSNSIRAGYALDYSKLVLDIEYTDGAHRQVKASELQGVTFAGYEAGSTSFKVTYLENLTASMPLTQIKVVRISALNDTVPALVFQGGAFNYADMKLSVYYDNGDVYRVPFTDKYIKITPAKFDTSSAGTKAISFVYCDGISYFTYIDAVSQKEVKEYNFTTVVNVIVRGITSVEIVEESVFPKAYVGMKVDTSNISVKVTYDDGTYIYVKRDNPALKVGDVNTFFVGKATLEVEYSGVKDTMTITVVEAPTVDGLIFGALLPDALVTRESYKGNFKDDSSPYYVGDDNPFNFYLDVILLDANDNIIDVDGKTIPTSATIYKDGSSTPLTKEELPTWVEFDSINNSYDFTEAAIGHTFRIVIRPADSSSYIDEASVTKEYTVTIVDGYNVYEAWELNVMTNVSRDITQECFGKANAINQVEVVDKFLASKGVTRPSTLAAIVIHGNLDVGEDDIPPEYVYTDSNGVKQGIYDQLGLFWRNLDMNQKTFSIYGNYFTVYSYNVPTVTPKGVANNPDEYSSSDLFKIRLNDTADSSIRTEALAGKSKPFEQFVVNIQDIATRDNDPNSNDQSASERHMRGLTSYKVGENVTNMHNVNIDAFMTSIIVEEVNSTLNLDDCKLYNAWQGHLFLWNENEHQDDCGGTNEATWGYIENLKVNINDSLLGKCGGPVILVQAPHYNENYNKTSGAEVNITGKSDVYTHVTGQEAWFVAVGQTQLAAQIRAMSSLISGPGGPHGFTSTDQIQGVETITMIMVAMAGEGMSLNGDMCNASLVIDGEPVMKTHSPINVTDLGGGKITTLGTFANPVLDEYVSSGAPIFQTIVTSTHPQLNAPLFSTAYTDGQTGCYVDKQLTKPGAEFYMGDYITLYYGGAAISLKYVHK